MGTRRLGQWEAKRRAAVGKPSPRSPLVVAEVRRGAVRLARSKLGSSSQETRK